MSNFKLKAFQPKKLGFVLNCAHRLLKRGKLDSVTVFVKISSWSDDPNKVSEETIYLTVAEFLSVSHLLKS